MKNSSNLKTKQKLEFRKCEETDFYNEFSKDDEFFKFKKYLDYECFDNYNYTLKGAYNHEIFQYVEYGIYLNWTNYINNYQEFEKFFTNNQFYAMVKYFELSIDMNNLTIPISSYENNVYNYINLNSFNKVNLDFSVCKFQTDENYFINNPETTDFAKLDSVQSYSSILLKRNPNLRDSNLLFKYYIRSSPRVIILNRIYQKLPQLLAIISGIASNFYFIYIVVNTFYNKFKSKEELVNHMLKFKENYNLQDEQIKQIKSLNIKYIEKTKGNNKGNEKTHLNNYSNENNNKQINENKLESADNENSKSNNVKKKLFGNFLNKQPRENLSSTNQIPEIYQSKNKVKDTDNYLDFDFTKINSEKINDQVLIKPCENIHFFRNKNDNNENNIKMICLDNNTKNKNDNFKKIDKEYVNYNKSQIKNSSFSHMIVENKINSVSPTNQNFMKEFSIIEMSKIASKRNNTDFSSEQDIHENNHLLDIKSKYDILDNKLSLFSPKINSNIIKTGKSSEEIITNPSISNVLQDNQILECPLQSSEKIEDIKFKDLQEIKTNEDSKNKGKKRNLFSGLKLTKALNDHYNKISQDVTNIVADISEKKEIDINHNQKILGNSQSQSNLNKESRLKNLLFKNSSFKFLVNKTISSLSDPNKLGIRKYEMVIRRTDKQNDKNELKKSAKKVIPFSFNFNPKEIIFRPLFICCKCNYKKYEFYEKCNKNIDHHLNIIFYMKLIQEIEIVKTLIFNEYDIGLINFIAKPLVSEYKSLTLPDSDQIEEMFVQELDIENVLYALEKKLEESKLEKKDHMLIEMINNELNDIMENKEK